jgi:ELWxxDGT repeat protein
MRAVVVATGSVVLAASLTLSPGIAPPLAAATAGEVGLSLVRDIHPSGSSNPEVLTRLGDRLFFSATDGTSGRELWVSDGTESGTRRVRDIRSGPKGSLPLSLTRVGSRLFFTANDGTHGRELWVSDGTRAGTRMVRDLRPGATGSRIDLGGIMDVAGSAIVSNGTGLYRSDGTAQGTRLIRTFDQVSPFERHAARRGRVLFFGARDRPLQDDALWRTDGTSAGTYRISPRQLGPFGLTRFGRHIFFGASPGSSAPGLDPLPELWMTSGTMASTRRVGTLRDPADLTVLGDSLYFNAQRSGASSSRLFRSDGTIAGTVPVRPRVGPLIHMVREGGRLWNNITTSDDGSWEADALWVSDGTAAGTKLVYGNDGAWVARGEDWLDCAASGGRLYFAAGTRWTGP